MTLFEFERDFAGSLRCIPMLARMKLDLCGIKLSLRQWSRFSHEERATLVDLPFENDADKEAYRALLLTLIETRTDEPARFLATDSFEEWEKAHTVPDIVATQAIRDGIREPTLLEWRNLTPLQRFSLVKLSRCSHENANFRPAMREFLGR
ncbi:nitrate reductase associated protein [Acetobacter conturbans]|uniref:Nitrate reductase maturation protein NarM n=1 Tax=Acetobacter conturbans TaxID=1737472 RepID=A0ABX0JZW4_9PROT|nr:nitrate reductase associated protein [Acetobacter conturbans]NHN88422.1 nitrate reductase maturation protein NarM [Acetobacter conturbans]